MRSIKSPVSFKIAAVAAALFAGSAMADVTYNTDQGHTEVKFSWNHAGVSIQSGEFDTAAGTVVLADDIEKSTVEMTIDAASVSTGFEALDTHLKSADFLEVETHPTMTFKSTSVAKTGDTTMDVTGDLTLHGVTKEVTMSAEITHQGPHPVGQALDYYKGEWLGLKATTDIDHQAFGVGGFSTGPITVTFISELKAPE